MTPKIYNAKWLDPESFDFPCSVELYNNTLNIRDNDAFKVLMVFSEPERFRPNNFKVKNHHSKFDLILAHDPALIRLGNAVKFPYGVTWINDSPKKKKYGVSFICGNKNRSEGHKLRHCVWASKHLIKMPAYFWTSFNANFPGKKLPRRMQAKELLFDCQYHIAIENTRVNNYFSEKLIDCLKAKTIPIYWGCPNIGRYFDLDGIIKCKSLNDILKACESKPMYYKFRKKAIERNYRLSMRYWSVEPRIQKVVESYL